MRRRLSSTRGRPRRRTAPCSPAVPRADAGDAVFAASAPSPRATDCRFAPAAAPWRQPELRARSWGPSPAAPRPRHISERTFIPKWNKPPRGRRQLNYGTNVHSIWTAAARAALAAPRPPALPTPLGNERSFHMGGGGPEQQQV